jgi:PAB1-binding protein PBP1
MEDMALSRGIKSTESVIQNNDFPSGVDRAGKRNALALATTESNTFASNDTSVATREL